MGRIIDLTGKRFGRLTVIERDYETQKKKHSNGTYWKCKCDCGNETSVASGNLKSRKVKSCGCLYIENSLKQVSNLINRRKKVLVEHTDLENIASNKPSKNNKSGVKGVFFNNGKQKWMAVLEFKGEKVLNKYFKNKQDAINARKEAEEKYFKPILEKYDYEKFS